MIRWLGFRVHLPFYFPPFSLSTYHSCFSILRSTLLSPPIFTANFVILTVDMADCMGDVFHPTSLDLHVSQEALQSLGEFNLDVDHVHWVLSEEAGADYANTAPMGANTAPVPACTGPIYANAAPTPVDMAPIPAYTGPISGQPTDGQPTDGHLPNGHFNNGPLTDGQLVALQDAWHRRQLPPEPPTELQILYQTHPEYVPEPPPQSRPFAGLRRTQPGPHFPPVQPPDPRRPILRGLRVHGSAKDHEDYGLAYAEQMRQQDKFLRDNGFIAADPEPKRARKAKAGSGKGKGKKAAPSTEETGRH